MFQHCVLKEKGKNKAAVCTFLSVWRMSLPDYFLGRRDWFGYSCYKVESLLVGFVVSGCGGSEGVELLV